MMQDNTSIVAAELAKGIRKIKNKLGAKQMVEAYQPDPAEASETESDPAADRPAVATDISTGTSLLWPPGYSPPAPDEIGLEENTARDLGIARRYGISFEQLSELLARRGLKQRPPDEGIT